MLVEPTEHRPGVKEPVPLNGTRPDIAFAVNIIAGFTCTAIPRQDDMDVLATATAIWELAEKRPDWQPARGI